jgi:microcystin-dependent protein
MAALVFPSNPAGQTPVNTFSPTSTPVANTSNAFTYVYDVAVGVWTASSTASQPVPSGTRMIFQQTAAPTGWVKVTTYNNYAMRIVSGAVGTGGTVGFTTAFSSGLSSGSYTLTTADIPAHAHGVTDPGHDHQAYSTAAFVTAGGNGIGTTGGPGTYTTFTSTTGISIDNTGGDGAHSHTLPNFAVQYVDFIIATKS